MDVRPAFNGNRLRKNVDDAAFVELFANLCYDDPRVRI